MYLRSVDMIDEYRGFTVYGSDAITTAVRDDVVSTASTKTTRDHGVIFEAVADTQVSNTPSVGTAATTAPLFDALEPGLWASYPDRIDRDAATEPLTGSDPDRAARTGKQAAAVVVGRDGAEAVVRCGLLYTTPEMADITAVREASGIAAGEPIEELAAYDDLLVRDAGRVVVIEGRLPMAGLTSETWYPPPLFQIDLAG